MLAQCGFIAALFTFYILGKSNFYRFRARRIFWKVLEKNILKAESMLEKKDYDISDQVYLAREEVYAKIIKDGCFDLSKTLAPTDFSALQPYLTQTKFNW